MCICSLSDLGAGWCGVQLGECSAHSLEMMCELAGVSARYS
jgi:hypothetical protein